MTRQAKRQERQNIIFKKGSGASQQKINYSARNSSASSFFKDLANTDKSKYSDIEILNMAILSGDENKVRPLLSETRPNIYSLINAVTSGKHQIVHMIYEKLFPENSSKKGIENEFDENFNSLLQAAIKSGDLKMANFILGCHHNKNKDALVTDSKESIMSAIESNHLPMMQYVVDCYRKSGKFNDLEKDRSLVKGCILQAKNSQKMLGYLGNTFSLEDFEIRELHANSGLQKFENTRLPLFIERMQALQEHNQSGLDKDSSSSIKP